MAERTKRIDKKKKLIPVLRDEPEGWRELQEKAQSERDPKKFAALIDQMNRLLTEWEKKAATEEVTPHGRRPNAH